MVRARTATAVVGIAASLLISGFLWWQFDSLVFFLFVPFVPFLFRGSKKQPPVRECPTCGFRTRNETDRYCPRDGTRLESRE